MKNSTITHSMLHYLLTIHHLHERGERSRLIDLAADLQVARSSVTIAIKKIKEKNLVDEDEQHNLYLSPMGHKVVHEMLSNRTLLFYFLKDFLGVSRRTAEKDACLLENLISSETQTKLFEFMQSHIQCALKSETEMTRKVLTELCLCQYQSVQDFKAKQEGKSYLHDQECAQQCQCKRERP